MTLRLHFLRHGQTESSRDNVFCGGSNDVALLDDGVAMAEAFAESYRNTAWAAIYSSPQQRALKTAQTIAVRYGLHVRADADLREIEYGAWDGLSAQVVDRDFHDAYERWTADPAWNAPTNGETAVALARRMLGAVERITSTVTDGDVLVVSHKAAIRALLCTLLGVDVGRFRYRFGCPVGSVSIVEFTGRGPLAHAIGDRSHLTERLRNLPGT